MARQAAATVATGSHQNRSWNGGFVAASELFIVLQSRDTDRATADIRELPKLHDRLG